MYFGIEWHIQGLDEICLKNEGMLLKIGTNTRDGSWSFLNKVVLSVHLSQLFTPSFLHFGFWSHYIKTLWTDVCENWHILETIQREELALGKNIVNLFIKVWHVVLH